MPDNIITSDNGNPYTSEAVAANVIKMKKLNNATPIEIEGGWGILTEQKTPIKPPKIEASAPWIEARMNELNKEFLEIDMSYRMEYRSGKTINKAIREGWVVDREYAKKMRESGLLYIDESLDNTYIVGDQILMKIPKHRVEARNKFYHDRTADGIAKKRKEALDNQLSGCGVKSVGSIEIERKQQI